MARRTLCSAAGYVHHVLNRAVGRATLFNKAVDYAAFEKILRQLGAPLHAPVELRNHAEPLAPRRLARARRHLEHVGAMAYSAASVASYPTEGTGPISQGRFKSVPVQEEDHFLTLCRSVERNPLGDKRAERAENWRRSSLWHRTRNTNVAWLNEWPIALPSEWVASVNGGETESERAA